jgi:hypothetical protein
VLTAVVVDIGWQIAGLASESVRLGPLFPGPVFNLEVELREKLGLLGLPAVELFRRYKVL